VRDLAVQPVAVVADPVERPSLQEQQEVRSFLDLTADHSIELAAVQIACVHEHVEPVRDEFTPHRLRERPGDVAAV